jgi:hypothetical protein
MPVDVLGTFPVCDRSLSMWVLLPRALLVLLFLLWVSKVARVPPS